MGMNTGLYWFEHDLRLQDNQALSHLLQEVKQAHLIYIFQPKWFVVNDFGHCAMGQHRYRFLRESLHDLQQQLSSNGQQLHIYYGEPDAIIMKLHEQYEFTHVAKHFHTGVYECNQFERMSQLLQSDKINSKPQVMTANSYTLYNENDLPMSVANLPDVFSPFRRKVEKDAKPQAPIKLDLNYLPAPCESEPSIANDLPKILGSDPILAKHNKTVQQLIGGETQARAQMQYYTFGTQGLSTYKETRNGLEGWDFSSKLSPWLAAGCISARQVAEWINEYEGTYGANDSTYWLFFELLWREFYQWQQYKYGHHMYQHKGIQQHTPTGGHQPDMFVRWCNGSTDYPIINACMRQLKHTGFMSNRGRQLVASCLVHELGLNWQYGAAYFEQMLIDFDPASNWGNWQYLAGVGSDPRGLRRFNLAKQTQTYDPDGEFIAYWSSYTSL